MTSPAPPALSIVVASRTGDGSISSCLEGLAGQLDGGQLQGDVELIVVEDERSDRIELGDRHLARLVVRPGALVPELWSAGIHQATGRLVGLLASTMVPGPDWVGLTLKLHEGGAAAIGGGIEPGAGMGIVDWAVFFCRYAPYMAPIRLDPSLEIAGDNASYRREVLMGFSDLFAESFSEPFVHRAMRAAGHELRVEPARIVHHTGGADAPGFCRQRFLHGRDHGRQRSAGQARSQVLMGAATAPLVPLLMTLRVARHVAAKRRHRCRFLVSLPLAVWFYSWWAAGELVGRLGSASSSAA